MSASAYAGVLKWASKEAWRERFEEILEDHLGAVWEDCDAESYDDLMDHLGVDLYAQVWNAAFEDLLSRVWDDGSNIVDDYLKRRGFKETATSRDLLSAYRGTPMTLWEVVEVGDGPSVLVRDLVCGGEPVWVDSADAGLFEPGEHIGARLLHTRRKIQFAMAVLPFHPGESAAALSVLKAHIVEAVEGEGCSESEAGRRALARNSGLITVEWLADRSDAPDDAWDEDDGEPVVTFDVRWPIKPGVSGQVLRAAFRETPAMATFLEGAWLMMDQNPAEPDPTGVGDLIGPVFLTEAHILLSAMSKAGAEIGMSTLAPVLAGLVGEPTITEGVVEPGAPGFNMAE
jgi:hypothetical protein